MNKTNWETYIIPHHHDQNILFFLWRLFYIYNLMNWCIIIRNWAKPDIYFRKNFFLEIFIQVLYILIEKLTVKQSLPLHGSNATCKPTAILSSVERYERCQFRMSLRMSCALRIKLQQSDLKCISILSSLKSLRHRSLNNNRYWHKVPKGRVRIGLVSTSTWDHQC